MTRTARGERRRTVLVLNAGSSSVKFAVARGRRIFLRGQIEHFGRNARVSIRTSRSHQQLVTAIPNLRSAFLFIRGLLKDLRITPSLVAHRIVHGGQRFSRPTRLTPSVVKYLHGLVELAPLHQPANLMGVAFAQKAWQDATAWGVFDTAVYRSMPERVRTYALPHELTKKLHIEKYGFHGTSHTWAFRSAAAVVGITPRKLTAVTVHLGAGSSMTLWDRGTPIDTTMGFTPLAGLVMSTRAGDIDPAIPLYLQEKLRWSTSKVVHLLEHESGLVGLCGLRDMRDVLGAIGHPVPGWPRRRWPSITRTRAKLALEVYVYYIRHCLAGYIGLLGNAKVIVFTGPIGANRAIQKMVLDKLPAARGIRRVTVPADEEQAIVDAVGK